MRGAVAKKDIRVMDLPEYRWDIEETDSSAQETQKAKTISEKNNSSIEATKKALELRQKLVKVLKHACSQQPKQL